MTTPELTTKQKLAALIARYRPHEDEAWHAGMLNTIMASDLVKDRFRLIGILLDPSGLKSAFTPTYGTLTINHGYLDKPKQTVRRKLRPNERAVYPTKVAYQILDAWLSKAEGNAVAAIDTAFSLLP